MVSHPVSEVSGRDGRSRTGEQDGGPVEATVGRSDHDNEGLNGGLHQHDFDTSKSRCTHFKFDYCASAKEAFERASTIYHEFDPSLNKEHPPRPAGTNYLCPIGGYTCFK